jgi:hypothetical protein
VIEQNNIAPKNRNFRIRKLLKIENPRSYFHIILGGGGWGAKLTTKFLKIFIRENVSEVS